MEDKEYVIPIVDFQREIYEMDAIEAKEAEAFNNRMIAMGYEKCEMCEHWKDEDEGYNGLCDDCIEEIITDVTPEEVMEYASTLDKEDELVLYTEYLFTSDELLIILKRAVKDACILDKRMFARGIKQYIANDISHYIDYLNKKGDLI